MPSYKVPGWGTFKSKLCEHIHAQGHADNTGAKIIFTCPDCKKIVKTIWQEGLHVMPSPHPVTWDAPSTIVDDLVIPTKHSGNLLGFYQRDPKAVGKGMLDSGKASWEYKKWSGVNPAITTVTAVMQQIDTWNNASICLYEYAVVRCLSCGVYHNQADWVGTHCPACEENKAAMKPKPIMVMKPAGIIPPKLGEMKNGEVRKLPSTNSPMWTTQWAVQGTAKMPYVVSRRAKNNTGAQDSDWACSCPDWTKHSPRTECKHILKVMQIENMKPSSPPVALLPKAQQEAFQKFLLQQAAAGTPALPAGKAKPFITTGRRFR